MTDQSKKELNTLKGLIRVSNAELLKTRLENEASLDHLLGGHLSLQSTEAGVL